ncbi:MAG: tyrosine-type recombinase/integrase [Roseiarcus sp.]
MRLTKTTIGQLPTPASGQKLYYADAPKGLGVRVTAGGTKSFVLEKLIGGKVRRITLGRCNDIPVSEAEKLALQRLAEIARGLDPIAEKKRRDASATTLAEVFEAYVDSRALKSRTLGDYRRVVEIAFADWRRKPLAAIGREAVKRRFAKLRDDHGPAWANLCMRVLRALWRFAEGHHSDNAGRSPFPPNPTKVLSETRLWVKIDRRRTLIQPHELAPWCGAVSALSSETMRDYLLLLLFTGLRRREGARLRWTDVDLEGRTLTIANPKNGKPHTLPLPPYILEMLSQRRQGAKSPFVFPGGGASGHIEEPKKAAQTVARASGVDFSIHDLRRTFITIAESLDIPAYTLKRLLNHADGADVTSGYIVMSVERLRVPMEKIASYLLHAMGIGEGETIVVSFPAKSA